MDVLSAQAASNLDGWAVEENCDDAGLDEQAAEYPPDRPPEQHHKTISSGVLMLEKDGSAGRFESLYGTDAFAFEKLNQLQAGGGGGWAFAA
eukprot:SAG22_NODE_14247_length_380_cov_1.046263_1_plen_91_part_01